MADPTFTYSGDPSTSDKDAVRFLLFDTHENDKPWLFSDETIAYVLSEQGNAYAAAAELALIQGTRYTDKRDKTVGPLSIKYGEVASRWEKLATSIKRRGARVGGGAIAIMTQRPRPAHFRLGIHDNLQTPDPWYLDPRDLTNYSKDDLEGFPEILDGGDIG